MLNFDKYKNMEPEQLEPIIFKFTDKLKYLPYTNSINPGNEHLIVRVKRFLDSIEWKNIFKDPVKIIRKALKAARFSDDDITNIVNILGVVSLFGSLGGLGQALKSMSNTKDKDIEIFNKATLVSFVCSVYMTIIEIYLCKKTPELSKALSDYTKNKASVMAKVITMIKKGEIFKKPLNAIKYILTEVIKGQLAYWDWQLKLGSKDPLFVYNGVWVMNLLSNTTLLLFGLSSVYVIVTGNESPLKSVIDKVYEGK